MLLEARPDRNHRLHQRRSINLELWYCDTGNAGSRRVILQLTRSKTLQVLFGINDPSFVEACGEVFELATCAITILPWSSEDGRKWA
jgi:hypothetical protein